LEENTLDNTDNIFDINAFLRKAVEEGVSDVHLRIDEVPVVRKDGKIIKTNFPQITEKDISHVLNVVLPKYLRTKVQAAFDLDFSYEIKGLSRFRINLARQMGNTSLVFRIIPYEIPTFEQLHLPPALNMFSKFHSGIVLVTGPTGSGKSTTIASLIDLINKNERKHIITIEDPIEFIYSNKNCIITQRQVEIDTLSFPDGVKYALRQDPDVILIGEIRDIETLSSAMKAAETGHLVIASLHTNDAIQTVSRIVGMYEPQDRASVRKQLAETLKACVAQKLLPLKSGHGRIPACEIMVVTPTIKDFIIKDELEQIYDLVKKGSYNDMITMNMSLLQLIKEDLITKDTALEVSDNKVEIQQMLRGAYHGTTESFDIQF
jgi:twitching motility protein